jgi:hypothetical protein
VFHHALFHQAVNVDLTDKPHVTRVATEIERFPLFSAGFMGCRGMLFVLFLFSVMFVV